MKKLISPVVALCITATICLCACSAEKSAAAKIPFIPDNDTDIVNDIPYSDEGKDYHLPNVYGTASAEYSPAVIEIHGDFTAANQDNKKTSKKIRPPFRETVPDLF